MSSPSVQVATFAGGCFWCVEAVFTRLKGVIKVESGYAGGTVENPTYEQVCSGQTGHAEVIHIEFNASEIQFEDLLNVFFTSHDPTTLNRQGNDVGTQYRSEVFYHNDAQKLASEAYIKAHEPDFDAPIVTAITPINNYHSAENYHQDYYARNPQQGYCNAVIPPKLAKLRQKWLHLLKDA
ncbi:peptide-methionine (S)-S-oxide reductase MsrA [Echinimonas agarilytica]|uniref:Peptide methionine sulfoxide reductase MsrA n=1 Tax=Echinimonas agarilytica TaxID=1215918 RepID=A0AA41W894_9GAMM|nr:peptide-methionine (S)-S-oxide reductase MsrA [Echinimonas agarilytica]MCM2681072.1 peptide-methionine (S)-S-oxide reductase MsrA [Echinimonas agarilytica]